MNKNYEKFLPPPKPKTVVVQGQVAEELHAKVKEIKELEKLSWDELLEVLFKKLVEDHRR